MLKFKNDYDFSSLVSKQHQIVSKKVGMKKTNNKQIINTEEYWIPLQEEVQGFRSE